MRLHATQEKAFHVRIAVPNLVHLSVEVDPIGEHRGECHCRGGLRDEIRIVFLQVFPVANFRWQAGGVLHRRKAGDEERIRSQALHALFDLAIEPVDDEATAITVVTPITIPRMVRPERTLRARSVSSATERFSSTSWRVIRPPFGARSLGRDWLPSAPGRFRKIARSWN